MTDIVSGSITAESNLTGEISVYPPVNFLKDGSQIDSLSFENLFAGNKSKIQKLTAVNNTGSDIELTLTPSEDLEQVGSALDTYLSTYMSPDNESYNNNLTVTIPGYGSSDFYVYYNPPSTAEIGLKKWNIGFETETPIPEWLYESSFTLQNVSGELQSDLIVIITLNYVSGKMQTDFGDIRFYSSVGRLDSSLDFKVDSNYAIFLVRIPVLNRNETRTFYVRSGNSLADMADDKVYTEHWDWLDGTLLPWVHTGSQDGLVNTNAGWGHKSLELISYVNTYWSWVTTPSKGVYGRWTMKFKIDNPDNPEVRFYPIYNGTHSYSIRFDQTSNIIALYLDETVLTSTTWAGDSNTHILIVTRDLDGLFNVYIDGALLLTATDNSVTTSTTITLGINARYWFMSLFVDYINFVEYKVPPLQSSLSDYYNRMGIDVNASILYKSRYMPEQDPEVRIGCRIGGVLFNDIIKSFEVAWRVNEATTNFNIALKTALDSDKFKTGETFDFDIDDSTLQDEFVALSGIITNAKHEFKTGKVWNFTGRDKGRLLTKQGFSLDANNETPTEYTVLDILEMILEDTTIRIRRGQTSLSKVVYLTNDGEANNRFCGSWSTKEKAINQLFAQYIRFSGCNKFKWYIDFAGEFRWFELNRDRGNHIYLFEDERRIVDFQPVEDSDSVLNVFTGFYGSEEDKKSVTLENSESISVYGRCVADPITKNDYTESEMTQYLQEQLDQKSVPIFTGTLELIGFYHIETGNQLVFMNLEEYKDIEWTVVDGKYRMQEGESPRTLINLSTDKSAISIPNEFDIIQAIAKKEVQDNLATTGIVTEIGEGDRCNVWLCNSGGEGSGSVVSCRNPGGNWKLSN